MFWLLSRPYYRVSVNLREHNIMFVQAIDSHAYGNGTTFQQTLELINLSIVSINTPRFRISVTQTILTPLVKYSAIMLSLFCEKVIILHFIEFYLLKWFKIGF